MKADHLHGSAFFCRTKYVIRRSCIWILCHIPYAKNSKNKDLNRN